MPMTHVNALAVLVAAVLTMVLGAVWYSPVLFAKQWMAAQGHTPEALEQMKRKGMIRAYAVSFLCYLVTAYVVALSLPLRWHWAGPAVPRRDPVLLEPRIDAGPREGRIRPRDGAAPCGAEGRPVVGCGPLCQHGTPFYDFRFIDRHSNSVVSRL